jgi:hypothetical protein
MQFSSEKIRRDSIAATDILLPAGWHAKLPLAEGIGKNLQNESSETTCIHFLFQRHMRCRDEYPKAKRSPTDQRWPAYALDSLLLDYFDANARLVIGESREASGHFIGLLFLIAIALHAQSNEHPGVRHLSALLGGLPFRLASGMERLDLRRRFDLS